MSLTEKPIIGDNAVVDDTPSEGHSFWISKENLRFRNDYGNHNKDQMDETMFEEIWNQKQHQMMLMLYLKLMQVLEQEVLRWQRREGSID